MKNANNGGRTTGLQRQRAICITRLIAIGCAAILASSCSNSDAVQMSATSTDATQASPQKTELTAQDAADVAAKAAKREADEIIARMESDIAWQQEQSALKPADVGIGSRDYCSKLAVIAQETFKLKEQGIPLNFVTENVSQGLAHDPMKQRMAVGVVIAIYGDSSLRTEEQAHQAALDGCSS